ncbi:hypothetical protein [Acinetobacter courvalinii]|uniref:hypothetical protein n=1 Tax=Acinetobacter courvalinii TaxID=280147 RepID=UPI0002CFF761|nr:hypothetical protein [Acinetobacter courvalinii]ENX06530.1 hypothetical protein F898_03480 [Acinetobacter courvalinii]
MNFFEMIYHSGPEDFECDFYKENTEKSRRHFFNKLMNDAKQSLKDSKQDPSLGIELRNYLLASDDEAINALASMKEDFIKKGRAHFDRYISLGVAERTIKEV